MIHCYMYMKLQINMQVVTCEKMKMSEGLSLVPRPLGTRQKKKNECVNV